MDLSGIEVLETDRRIIAQAKVEVHSQAEKMLNSGMSSLVKYTLIKLSYVVTQ